MSVSHSKPFSTYSVLTRQIRELRVTFLNQFLYRSWVRKTRFWPCKREWLFWLGFSNEIRLTMRMPLVRVTLLTQCFYENSLWTMQTPLVPATLLRRLSTIKLFWITRFGPCQRHSCEWLVEMSSPTATASKTRFKLCKRHSCEWFCRNQLLHSNCFQISLWTMQTSLVRVTLLYHQFFHQHTVSKNPLDDARCHSCECFFLISFFYQNSFDDANATRGSDS